MNIKSFIRNVSLFKLGISELDGNEKRVYGFLMDKTSGLNYYTNEEYPDSYFLGKTEEEIVFLYHKDTHLEVSYDKIWYFFENKIGIDYNEIQYLIKWWVEINLLLSIRIVTHSTGKVHPSWNILTEITLKRYEYK